MQKMVFILAQNGIIANEYLNKGCYWTLDISKSEAIKLKYLCKHEGKIISSIARNNFGHAISSVIHKGYLLRRIKSVKLIDGLENITVNFPMSTHDEIVPFEKRFPAVFELKVASLPAFPLILSEEDPLFIVSNPGHRRNYGVLHNILIYRQANSIIELLKLRSLTKKEISENMSIHLGSVTKIIKKLIQDKIVHDEGMGRRVHLIKNEFYNIDNIKRGIKKVKVNELEVGNYLVFRLKNKSEIKIIIDMADYLDHNLFYILDNEIRYGWGSKEYNEIRSYLEKYGVPQFKWGKGKNSLKIEVGMNTLTKEHKVQFVQDIKGLAFLDTLK